MSRHPSHLRIAFVCVALLGALLIFAAPVLAEGTAVVHGVLSDNAVVQKPIANAVVTVGDMAATVTGQSYTVANVAAGPQTMVVKAPRHMPLTQVITVLPGDFTADVALNLTAKETYLRYYAAYNHKRFATAWKMVHPDVKGHLMQWGRRLTYRMYSRDMLSWHLPFVSMRIQGVKTDAKWTPRKRAHLPHGVYYGITHIDRVIRYTFPEAVARELGVPTGRIYTDDCYIHWQNIQGRWYTIFDHIWYDR